MMYAAYDTGVLQARAAAPNEGPSARNRGRMDVLADVLMTCETGANKNRIMLRANINSVVASGLLGKMMACGLAEGRREDDGTTYYFSTHRGQEFVRRYLELSAMLAPALRPNSSMLSRSQETWR